MNGKIMGAPCAPKLGKITAAVGAVALLAFAKAEAATAVYNSFGPGRTNCACLGPVAAGPSMTPSYLPKGADWLAATFKPKSSGQLDEIFLSITLNTGYSGAVVVLVPDNGSNQPNSLGSGGLETWVVTNIPAFNHSTTATRLVSKLNPTITAGQAYWIIVEPIGLDTSLVWWSSPKVQTTVKYSSTGGGTWSGYTSSQSAFEVWVK